MSELPSFFHNRKKLESHKKLCENKDFCNVIIPFEDAKILEFNQYQKSDKAPFIIYADLECIIEKLDWCKNNQKNWSTRKVSEHIPSGFSMSTISSFRSIENKYDTYRGKDYMEKFCESLRDRRPMRSLHVDIFIGLTGILHWLDNNTKIHLFG